MNIRDSEIKQYNSRRDQYRFDIDRTSATDGYEKVRWMLEQGLAWGKWRFTAYAIWINADEVDAILLFKLTFGGKQRDEGVF